MILETYQKNNFNQKITIKENNLPVNLTGYNVIFIVKNINNRSNNDNNALINKNITIATSTDAENGIFFINLNQIETNIKPNEYIYQIDLISPSLNRETIFQDKFIIKNSIIESL